MPSKFKRLINYLIDCHKLDLDEIGVFFEVTSEDFYKYLEVAEKKYKEDNDPRNEMFNLFWKAYPNKKNKERSLKAFKKINPNKELFGKIMQSVEENKKTSQWQKGIIPHASTWLNGKRWLDELPEDKPPKAGKRSKSKIQADNSYNFDKEEAERALFGD